MSRAVAFALALGALWLAGAPAAAVERGDVVYANNLGLPLYTHTLDTGKDVGIGDRQYLSEFMGAHYYVTDRVRAGMMVQFTEQLGGAVPAGADRFTTVAPLPQVGWNFYDRFLAAAIFTGAVRAGGRDQYDLGVQALLGYGVPLPRAGSFNLALEVPYNFHVARTIGLTPLVGLSFVL